MTEQPDSGQPGRGEKVIERSLSLFLALRAARRGLTWTEIVAAVEDYSDTDAGRKAFLRDRGILEQAGFSFVPGDFSAAEYRYRLAEWTSVPDFTSQERAVLSLAGVALADASVAKSAGLAVERLTAELASDEPHPLASWRPLLPPDSQLLAEISRAIAERSALQFAYTNATGGESERVLWPWAVQSYGPDWYVLGFDTLRSEPRMFRFSRISALRRAEKEALELQDPVPLSERAPLIRDMLSTLAEETRQPLSILVRPGRAPWIRAFGDPEPGPPPGWEAYSLPGHLKEEAFNVILAAPPGDAVIAGPGEASAEFADILTAIETAHSQAPAETENWPPLRRERAVLSAPDRVYRGFTLLRILAENGPTHLDELAGLLRINRGVLEEDIRAMAFAETGVDGALSLTVDDDGWVTLAEDQGFDNAPAPPLEQLIPLIAALGRLAGMTEADETLSNAAHSAQLKLLLSGSEAEGDGHWAAESLLEATRAQSPSGPTGPLLATALRAIGSGQGLAFRYLRESEEESQQRWVAPRGLVLHHGRHYLRAVEVGRGSTAPRDAFYSSPGEHVKHFRLDRCAELTLWEMTPAPVIRVPDDDAESPQWAKRRKSRTAVQAEMMARSSPSRSAADWLEVFNARDIRGLDRDLLTGTVNVAGGSLVDEILCARGALSVERPPDLRREISQRCVLLRKAQGSMSKID